MLPEEVEAIEQHVKDEKAQVEKELQGLTYSDRWWMEGQIDAYDEVLAFIRALREADK